MLINKVEKAFNYLLRGKLSVILQSRLQRRLFLLTKSDFLYWLDPERVLNRRFERLFSEDMGSLEPVANYFVHKSCKLDDSSIVYSGGLGGDADFDIELATKYGCQIHIFDPTPSSCSLGRSLEKNNSEITFYPIALWDAEEELQFAIPTTGGSASAVFGHNGSKFEAIGRPISRIMADHRHDRIDLLKLDIEGAAERVLWAMFEDRVFPRCIVCEFERPIGDVVKTSKFFVGIDELVKFSEAQGYQVLRLPREKYNYFGIHLMFVHI